VRGEAPQARHLRIELSGEVDKDCAIDGASLAAELRGDLAELVIVDATRPNYDLDELAQQQTVRGIFVREMLARLDGETDELEHRRLEVALEAGLRALDGREDVVHVD
jgi:DNA repair protein SbcD/Mre11